jgi:hypothetical protein
VARDPERPARRKLTSDRDIRNPLFARLYVRVFEPFAKRDKNRGRLFEDVAGRVLELGCGSGVNFVRYPPSVTEVIAVEPEPSLRE